MKGVILAGGTGSRLYPLTKIINKHLLPVGKYPMICYPLDRMKRVGIKKVLIVTNQLGAGQMINLFGSGKNNGLEITYRIQDQPGGIADALGMAEDFASGEELVVLLGDNIFQDELGDYVAAFQRQKKGAKVFLKEVTEPEGYGIAELNDERIVGIEEKPEFPKTNLCVTGIYMYDNNVFNIIRTLQPSRRGELEISDVNRVYLEKGEISYEILKKGWMDAGTFENLSAARGIVEAMELGLDLV
jgi:glucose-1-phosphate thymidylyltransferase